MFRTIRTRIIVIASAVVMMTGMLAIFGGGQAFAINPAAQICRDNNPTGNICLNAWNSGPWVNVYTNMGATPNDKFSINNLNNGNTYLEFVGGGAWNGQCIGDSHNNQNEYFTSLDPCPTNSYSGGWGTNFKEEVCGEGDSFAFKNVHWGGYLQPSGSTNGSNFQLVGGKYCFTFFLPGDH
ncbi:MAG TPA: hypothetical protein VLG47_00690 [Candidatus Saccharimonadales bacterium]|nr:hypothetical protein [Candidatus Saccharimonadales bacterium]